MKRRNIEERVTRAITKAIREQAMELKIKRALHEALLSLDPMSQYENENGEDGRESDENTENTKQKSTRRNVIKFFKRKGVDHAPYAYRLYNVTPKQGQDTDEMKNARSKFEKCLNGEPNENGYPYSFTSQEINRLKDMASDNQL